MWCNRNYLTYLRIDVGSILLCGSRTYIFEKMFKDIKWMTPSPISLSTGELPPYVVGTGLARSPALARIVQVADNWYKSC